MESSDEALAAGADAFVPKGAPAEELLKALFPEQTRQIGSAFARVLGSSSDGALASPLNVPWFDFAMTCRDGLLQVLTQSAQHRPQVLSWLSAHGIATPDLDYVLMLREAQ